MSRPVIIQGTKDRVWRFAVSDTGATVGQEDAIFEHLLKNDPSLVRGKNPSQTRNRRNGIADQIRRQSGTLERKKPTFTRAEKMHATGMLTGDPIDKIAASASGLLPESIGGFRDPLIMAGGTAGSALGLAGGMVSTPLTGPIGPLGSSAVGGGLGAASGSVAADAIADISRAFGIVGPGKFFADDPSVGGPGSGGRALRAGGLDFAFGAIPGALQARKIGQRIAGVGAGGRIARAEAVEEGVPLGIQDVTDRPSLRFAGKVIGIFPFLGTKFRQATTSKAAALAESIQRKLMRIGTPVDAVESGIRLHAAAIRKYKAVSAAASKKFEHAWDLGKSSDARVNVDELIRTADEMVDAARSNRPTMLVESLDEAGEIVIKEVEMPPVIKNLVLATAKKIQRLKGTQTFAQMETLRRDINHLFEKSQDVLGGKSMMRDAMTLKKALGFSLEASDDEAVNAAFKVARENFHNTMRVFETTTAKRFERVSPRIFGSGFETAGEVPIDKLFFEAFESSSPQMIRELRDIVGPQEFRVALSTHLENVMDTATAAVAKGDITEFSPGKFMKLMGLEGPRQPKFQALKEALKDTGVSIGELQRFARVLGTAIKLGKFDVNTFVTRRVTLGGARAGARLLPGAVATSAFTGAKDASIIGNGIKMLGFLIGVRKFASVMTSPASLKAATRMLDLNLPGRLRNQAALRFLRLTGGVAASAGVESGREAINETIPSAIERRGSLGLSALQPRSPLQ